MNNELENRQVLIVEDDFSENSAVISGALGRLIAALSEKHIDTLEVASPCEALPVVDNNMDIDAFLVAVDMQNPGNTPQVHTLLHHIKERQSKVPVFLLADRAQTARQLSADLMGLANELVWIFEDSPHFIAGRVEGAIKRYRDLLLPPLMKAIWEYNEENHEYSWAAPGHQGGVGFTKSPEGKKFYDFYGENLFRTGSNDPLSVLCWIMRAHLQRVKPVLRKLSGRTVPIPLWWVHPVPTVPLCRHAFRRGTWRSVTGIVTNPLNRD